MLGEAPLMRGQLLEKRSRFAAVLFYVARLATISTSVFAPTTPQDKLLREINQKLVGWGKIGGLASPWIELECEEASGAFSISMIGSGNRRPQKSDVL